MSAICLTIKGEMLKIVSYNGDSKQGEIHQPSHHLENLTSNHKWNFFRQGNNHAYVKKNMFYEGDCSNNLIISPYTNNKLVDVRNAFIFVGDSSIEISPISDTSNTINKSRIKLSNQEINYNIPEAVLQRESLIEKNTEELKEEIRQKYGIKSLELSMVNKGRAENGIYYIKEPDGKEYILKFRGRCKEKSELLSRIAEDIPNYFPLNFHRKDNGDFTFEIKGELYGVEEFVRDTSPKVRDIKYFNLIGTHVGLLHKQLSNFAKNNKEVEKLLTLTDRHTSESNLISLYLDLSKNNQHEQLLSELEKIIEGKLNVNLTSKQLIHGDLNHSNLIWQGNNFKIVDSETLKIANRLDEFESPLLFKGNMERPEYVKKSLNAMIYAYNQSSQMPLSKKETKVLHFLVKYALLKNFVIRKIRRGDGTDIHLKEIIKNLKNIEEDHNDN